jgi:hypothetical protein
MDGFQLDELYWVSFLILVMCLLDRYFYQVLSCVGLLLSSTIAYFQLNNRNEIDVNTFISIILMVWMTIKCLMNLFSKENDVIENKEIYDNSNETVIQTEDDDDDISKYRLPPHRRTNYI